MVRVCVEGTVGDGESVWVIRSTVILLCLCAGDEDGDVAEGDDLRGLSKRDIHTLNEQRRRDIIKARGELAMNVTYWVFLTSGPHTRYICLVPRYEAWM